MFNKLLIQIEELGISRKYKPLTDILKNEYYDLYLNNLNGFGNKLKRELNINKVLIAKKYERVVVGDYGAYVEIAKEDLIITLDVKKGQEWRLNKEFLTKRKLNIKYEWYEYLGIKVYFQLETVLYADYKPGYYYISVLEFDKIENEKEIFLNNVYLKIGLSNLENYIIKDFSLENTLFLNIKKDYDIELDFFKMLKDYLLNDKIEINIIYPKKQNEILDLFNKIKLELNNLEFIFRIMKTNKILFKRK